MAVTLEMTVSRNGKVLYAPVDREQAVMFSVTAGRYYGVNAVGSRIWQLIATPITVAEICAKLREEFDVDAANCQAAVLKFINEAADNGILDVAEAR